MFKPGTYVAEHVDPIRPDQVQPNGVDLTLGSISEQVSRGRLTVDGKDIGERQSLEPTDDGRLELGTGGYILEYGERVRIPDGHVGFIYPRSSLMRNSCMLNTAVWDAGYEGRGEGLLQVHHPITLELHARVAQLVLSTADHDGTYDGTYQGERL